MIPALVLLGALVVWPVISTIQRSFFDEIGRSYVGTDNYRQLFTDNRLQRAIFNTFIWVALFPIFTTTIGLVLAVLSDKVSAKRAFRVILFMPAALALLSSGIIWRLVYEDSTDRGLANAVINVPVSFFAPEGDLAGAVPSADTAVVGDDGSVSVNVTVTPDGGVIGIGLLRLLETDLPEDAIQASQPTPEPGGLSGVVWRDTKPGANEHGVVEPGELGISGVSVILRDLSGNVIAVAVTGSDGALDFGAVAPGRYHVEIAPEDFRQAWGGVTWLGPDLITAAAVVAGIWVWGGFALLVIASGLAALPEELFEAAHLDGATDFQVFRHITVPLLKPVLTVVFVALTINALKMFDLIIGIAPGSVQDEANTVALEMWRTSFTGIGNRGLGSAIAVFLFLLAMPIMALNIRRFRLEETTA